ncbi:unnamed protein product, partial [Symbiodinium pilosum]
EQHLVELPEDVYSAFVLVFFGIGEGRHQATEDPQEVLELQSKSRATQTMQREDEEDPPFQKTPADTVRTGLGLAFLWVC